MAILGIYQMCLYHILKGRSQANFVQNLVFLTKFERFYYKNPSNSVIFLNYGGHLEKAALLERYQMDIYHISKGTSQANFVKNLVLLTKFERFLHIFTVNGCTILTL